MIKAPDKLPLEQIAALTPDLIIGTNAGLTEDVYASLTKIAPTIANSGKYDSDWFEPWPDPDRAWWARRSARRRRPSGWSTT